VERQLRRLIAPAQPARWGRYHPGARDDTTRHRTSQQVWGPCTFHESSARTPHRAATVRAHHWVAMGELAPGRPWRYLPHAARLSCRHSQLPAGETCRTTTALAVELLRQADAASGAPILAIFAGADAVDTVVGPGLAPAVGQQRIASITRLRADARRSLRVVARCRAQGRPPTWGTRMAAPQHHLYGPVGWQRSRAWGYGRLSAVQYKQLRCRWAVSGPQVPVHVVVERAGDQEPWFLVTTALDQSAAQAVAAWAARFRQAEGCRDHQQRLGMEECRAWTKEPILRTLQVQLVALTLLRLLQTRLDHAWDSRSWWLQPAWNRHKRHGSILDLRRLCWRYREAFSPFLVHLEEWEKIPQPLAPSRDLTGRVA
jgi:hypothetical protein